MKQMILTMVLLLSILSVSAQNTKNDSIQEKFFNAKVRELVYRLNITDEQKAKFVPIYRRYNEEMRTLWRNARMQMCPKPGDKNADRTATEGPKHRDEVSRRVCKGARRSSAEPLLRRRKEDTEKAHGAQDASQGKGLTAQRKNGQTPTGQASVEEVQQEGLTSNQE